MTPEQLAARWLADVKRFTVFSNDGIIEAFAEADALAAIARHLAPGDDLVAQAHEYAAMMRQDWDDWHSDEVADCKASTADVLDEAAARLSALTAERDQWRKAYHDAHDLFAQLDGHAATLRASLARMEGALRTAEAALADIGDAEREPEDDLAWCERRAADALPWVRAALTESPADGGKDE